MNNPTIDGVSREEFERSVATLYDHADLRKRNDGCYINDQIQSAWWGWKERSALLNSPAVDRKAQGALIRYRELCGHSQDGREIWHAWTDLENVTVSFAESKLDQTRDLTSVQYEVRWLYEDSMGAAALQSTIAQLQDRIAELESGLGEPIYEMEYLGEGGGGWVETDKHQFDVTSKLKNFRTRIVFTAPPARVAEPEKYDDVLLPFLALMRAELHANAHKGDRPGWLQMDSKNAILEVFYHMGKLHQAVHRNETAAIKEYAADFANMCMMLLDVRACLDAAAAPNAPKPAEWYDVAGDDEGLVS